MCFKRKNVGMMAILVFAFVLTMTINCGGGGGGGGGGGQPTPSLISISPSTGAPGTIINITGLNLNSLDSSNILVYFQDIPANVTNLSADTVSLIVPLIKPGAYKVVLDYGNFKTSSLDFNVEPMPVYNISKTELATNNGNALNTITIDIRNGVLDPLIAQGNSDSQIQADIIEGTTVLVALAQQIQNDINALSDEDAAFLASFMGQSGVLDIFKNITSQQQFPRRFQSHALSQYSEHYTLYYLDGASYTLGNILALSRAFNVASLTAAVFTGGSSLTVTGPVQLALAKIGIWLSIAKNFVDVFPTDLEAIKVPNNTYNIEIGTSTRLGLRGDFKAEQRLDQAVVNSIIDGFFRELEIKNYTGLGADIKANLQENIKTRLIGVGIQLDKTLVKQSIRDYYLNVDGKLSRKDVPLDMHIYDKTIGDVISKYLPGFNVNLLLNLLKYLNVLPVIDPSIKVMPSTLCSYDFSNQTLKGLVVGNGPLIATAYHYTKWNSFINSILLGGNLQVTENITATATVNVTTNVIVDTTSPTAPTNLTTTVISSSQINLSWTASADIVGVTGYRVYRPSSLLSSPTTTIFSDTGLSANTEYCYTVKAIDAAGNLSTASSQKCATTLNSADTTPPTAPTNLTLTVVSSSQINLSWTASTDNDLVTGYEVYRPSSLVDTPTATNYSDTGLSANTQYCYTVKAIDSAGNLSAASSKKCATTNSITLCPGLDSNTRALYHFSENSGTIAADSSPNLLNGNLVGTTWDSNGYCGSALYFNGSTSSYVEIPQPFSGINNNFSIEFQFKTDTPQGDYNMYSNLYRHRAPYHDIAIALNNYDQFGNLNNYISAQISCEAGIGDSIDYQFNYADNNWHNVKFAYNGSQISLYIDSALVGQKSFTCNFDWTTNFQRETIGGNPYDNRNGFIGLIDEVKISGTASGGAVCGNGSCETGESIQNCPQDCHQNLAWQALTPSGSSPGGLYGSQVVYDFSNKRMVVYGGGNPNCINSTYTLSLANPGTEVWSLLSTGGITPPSTTQRAAIFDATNNRMIVHGAVDCGGESNATHSLTLGTPGSESWSLLSPAGTTAPGRYNHSAIYDSSNNRLIMFGGRSSSSILYNDVWALDLSTTNGSWQKLAPSGTPPSNRMENAAIYDSKNKRMIIFGGDGYGSPWVGLNDCYSLNLSTPGSESWTKLTPTGTPPSIRSSFGNIYDPIDQKMIIFGGNDPVSNAYFNDAWSLDLTLGSEAWIQLSPSGIGPSTRSNLRSVYDSYNRRMIVFGGVKNSTFYNDVYALTLP